MRVCIIVCFCVDSGASLIASIVVTHGVLPTGTCSTVSLRMHIVKQEVAETFKGVGSMCCHSPQACIGRFRECPTMCPIHVQPSWTTNVQLNFGSTPSHACSGVCKTRRRPSTCLCEPAAMVTHHESPGTLASVTAAEQYLTLARLRQRARDLWRSALRRVLWYLRLRKKWSAIGKYLSQVKPSLGPIENLHVPKLKKKNAGRSTSSR